MLHDPSGHELIEEAPELPFDVHVAIGSPDDPQAPIRGEPGPDPTARPIEGDRDPGDQQAEGQPDQALARVSLGDQQGVFADVAQLDAQADVRGDARLALGEGEVGEVLWDGRAIGFVPTTRYGRMSTTPVPSGSLRSRSCSPRSVPGTPWIP